jgi:SPP1 gp7 family putative phage head morphogenesis protein
MPRKPNAKDIARREHAVSGLLETINHDVAVLPDAALRELAPVLREAERRLAKDLERFLNTTDGAERYTAQMQRRALYQIRGALESIHEARPDMRRALGAAGTRAAKLAQAHLQRELAFFSFKFDKTLTPIPLVEASKVVQGALVDKFAASAARWDQKSRDIIRRELSIGLVRGQSVDQMTRALLMPRDRRRFGENATPGDMARAAARNLSRKVEYEARRIVRTEIIEAYNTVKLDMLAELRADDPGMMSRWVAALDGRTCPACANLDNVVVPVGGTFKGGVKAPPLHPFCRCAIVAFHKSWREAGEVRYESGRATPNAERYARPDRSSRIPRGRAPGRPFQR